MNTIPRICFFIAMFWLLVMALFARPIYYAINDIRADHIRIEDLAGVVQGLERDIAAR